MRQEEAILLACEYAKSFLGSRYRWGGETPMGGFDCSGLVQEILAGVGYRFRYDHNSQMIFDHMSEHGKETNPEAGALVFYGTGPKRIGHVGIMINCSIMIEAAGGSSDTITSSDAIHRKAFVKMRPWTRRMDYVACFMPNYEGV